MSVKPTIPDQYLPQTCGESPVVTFRTQYTGFMFLIFMITHPPNRWEYKNIRGVMRKCRAHWEVAEHICLPQINPEGSKQHTFALPTKPLGTQVYFLLSTECSSSGYIPATPPIRYTYKACPPGGSFIRIQRLNSTLLASTSDMQYADIAAGNPAAKVNNLTLKALTAGPYYLEAHFVGRADPNGTGLWNGHAKLTSNHQGIFATSGELSSDRGAEITLHVQGTVLAQANETFTSGWTRTSGTNLLQIPVSLNAESYFLLQPI